MSAMHRDCERAPQAARVCLAVDLGIAAPERTPAPAGAAGWRREWDSNPRTPVKMLLEFQSSAFDRSAISPRHQSISAQACGGFTGFGTTKDGGVSRQGSARVRGGGVGSFRSGMRSAERVSGAVKPTGVFRGAMLRAFA